MDMTEIQPGEEHPEGSAPNTAVQEGLGTEVPVTPEADADGASKDGKREVSDYERKLRSENERLRKERDDVKKDNLTLAERVDAIESRAAKKLYQAELQRVGAKLNVRDLEALDLFVQQKGSDLERDEDGTPTNFEAIAQSVIEAKTYLVDTSKKQVETPSAGGDNPHRAPNTQVDEKAYTEMNREQRLKFKHENPTAFAELMRSAAE